MSTPLFISYLNHLKVGADTVKLPAKSRFVSTCLTVVMALLLAGGICSAQTQGGTVVAWGDNSYGQTDVPPGLTNVVAVAAGLNHSLALKADGTVVAWGSNVKWDGSLSGQTNVPSGLNNVIAIAAGIYHSMALKSDGAVVVWGDNSYFECNVPSGLGNVVAIAAGGYACLAVKSDGTVVGWGFTGGYLTATSMPNNLSNAVSVACGVDHNAALLNNGTVVVWGDTIDWQYGQGNIPTSLSDVVAIEAGYYHTLALCNNGNMYIWGDQSTIPVSYTNVAGITAGIYHDLALQSDGSVVGWGNNSSGQSSVPASTTNIIAIAGGGSHSLMIVGNGSPTVVTQPFGRNIFSGDSSKLFVGVAGKGAVNYQWQFQNTNLFGATNSLLYLQNIHTYDSGFYRVAITNSYGSTTSQLAQLSIYDSIPIITTQPNAQACAVGSNATFTASVTGSQPFVFQWKMDGTNILGATNSNLILTNLQLSYEGQYSITISNSFGLIASSNAYLDVVDFGEALNATNFVWSSTGNAPWFVNVSPSASDGFADAQSGKISQNQQSTLQATVIGPGKLTYQWEPSSFPNSDYLSFSVNGIEQARISGSTLWQSQVFYLSTNTQNLQWTYHRTSSGGLLSDAVWLDQVNYVSGGTAPIITASPASQVRPAGTNVTFSVAAVGNAPFYYQWRFNSNIIAGATNNALALTNVQSSDAGAYDVQVGNDYGITNSAVATLGVVNSKPFFMMQPSSITVLPHGVAVFSTDARGSLPLSYQWSYYGTNLPDATNAHLIVTDVQRSDAGNYQVLVTNNYGSVASSNAILTVSSVVAWNLNNYGQATVPLRLGLATAIAGSQYNSLAVLNNGTLAAWGLGNTGSTNIPFSLTNIVNVALADSLGLAIKSDGTVGWWGTSSQTNLIPSLTNVMAVAASQGNFYLALQSNGRVTAWGANGYGQTNVPVGLSNAVSIAVGDYHSMALKNDGTVAVWGGNVKGIYGQTNIPFGLSNVVSIAGGNNFSLAVKSDGSVAGWPTNEPNVVMRIPASLTNAISVAADYNHALALTRDGKVLEWGTVGTGYLTNLMGFSNATAIACGYYHSLANLNDGTPVVFRQPWSQTFYAGYPATLSAGIVGPGPLSYQWQLNGTNLEGATNYILNLSHLRPTDAGAYCLLATNGLGTTISSNAALTVITYPPVLSLQPTNQTAGISSNATFSVAVGTGPIPNTYQWQFNGTNILGATNTILILTNIQMTNQGNYAVVVDNGYGTTTSSNAYLTVLPDLPTALNATALAWSTGGTAVWLAQTNTSHDGFAAAQSGLIANNRSSTLQTTVTGPGTLTFWWNFAPLTTPYPNTLSVTSSLGNASASVNSTTGWQQQNLYLGTGQQTVTWTYSRYFIISAQSTGYVDQVSFTPGSTAPTITSMSPNAYVRANSTAGFFANAYGTPPLAYQWQLNGTNLPNKTNASLVFVNAQPTNSGVYSVVITNSYGSISTNATLWVGQFALNTSSTNLFVSSNGFQLKLDGVLTTNPVVILGSTNMISWLPLFTNPATTGSIQFLDVNATNFPTRFYRAQE